MELSSIDLRGYRRDLVWAYSPTLALVGMMCIPFVNLIFGGHFGIGVVLLACALPASLMISVTRVIVNREEIAVRLATIAVGYVPFVIAASALSIIASAVMSAVPGNETSALEILKIAAIPFYWFLA